MKYWGLILCVGVAFAFAGCHGDGMERCAVSGFVAVAGTPIESGAVTLSPLPGTASPAVGASIENGIFEMSKKVGPAPGSYQVKFVGVRKAKEGETTFIAGMGEVPASVVNVVADKYAVPGGADIQTITLKPGKNEVKFDLDAE